MLRSSKIHKEIAKKFMLKSGEFVTVTHISGDPTWTGDYDQTPVYVSGTSATICRCVPLGEEIRISEQVYGVGDAHAWFPYDVTIGVQDFVVFSSTSLFSGTWVVGTALPHDTVTETYLRRQRG